MMVPSALCRKDNAIYRDTRLTVVNVIQDFMRVERIINDENATKSVTILSIVVGVVPKIS